MTEPLDPNHRADRRIEYEPGHVDRPGDRLSATPAAPGDPEAAALAALDERGRRAAHGLRAHVEQHLRSADRTPVATVSHRPTRAAWRSKVAAIAAVAALVVGFAATQGPGGDGDGRLEVDDPRRPELTAGLLTPLGPRDGKDSVQLPVTAEPATGLRDGDEVTVRGEGFVPGESVGVVQCAREAGGDTPETRGGVDGCYIGDYVNVIADDQGVAQGTYRIKRVLTTPLTGSVDCAAEAGRCIVAMGAISDYDRSGGLAIELDPDVEPVELPTVQVQPAEGLADGQAVRVTATGLTPGDVMYVEVCSADPAACWTTGEALPMDEGGYREIGLRADPDGSLDAEIPVWRFLAGGEPGTYVDCAISRCSLRLSGSTAPPTVPLRFRGDEPPPSAPAFGVEPTEGVAPGDEVVLAGEGFRPGSEVWVMLCAEPADGDLGMGMGACMGLDPPIEVGDDGAFTVARTLPEPPSYGGEETCDPSGGCRMEEGRPVICDGVQDRCSIRVEGEWGWTGGPVAPPIFPPAPVPVTFRP
jgi:hypothetical protein